MLDETGCDGILVARGSMGHPWIFEQIEAFLKGELPPSPSYEDIRQTAKNHMELYKVYREELSYVLRGSRRRAREAAPDRTPPKSAAERHYLGHLRKIAMWYSKACPVPETFIKLFVEWYGGLPYSKRAREAIIKASSYDEIVGVLDRLKQLNNPWLKR